MAWRKPDQISVKLSVPFVGEINGVWEPSDAERLAAWELYVELVTRVTVVHLGPDEGILREALTSFYSLFGTTREILRRHGPEVAPSRAKGRVSFGSLAVTVINGGIRPTLAKWHPLLTAHEAKRAPGVDSVLHERSWDRAEELRAELARTRASLEVLAGILAKVAKAELLVSPDLPTQRDATDAAGGGLRELSSARTCRASGRQRSASAANASAPNPLHDTSA